MFVENSSQPLLVGSIFQPDISDADNNAMFLMAGATVLLLDTPDGSLEGLGVPDTAITVLAGLNISIQGKLMVNSKSESINEITYIAFPICLLGLLRYDNSSLSFLSTLFLPSPFFLSSSHFLPSSSTQPQVKSFVSLATPVCLRTNKLFL